MFSLASIVLGLIVISPAGAGALLAPVKIAQSQSSDAQADAGPFYSVIQKFYDACARKDIEAVVKMGGRNATGLNDHRNDPEGQFAGANATFSNLAVSRIEIQGDYATATASVDDAETKISTGKARKSRLIRVFSFAKEDGEWKIVDYLSAAHAIVQTLAKETERRLAKAALSFDTQLYGENLMNAPRQQRVDSLTSKLNAARSAYDDFEANLYKAHPELAAYRALPAPIGIEAASGLLPDSKWVILEYVSAQNKTYLFALTKAAPAPDVQQPAGEGQRSSTGPTINAFELSLTQKGTGGARDSISTDGDRPRSEFGSRGQSALRYAIRAGEGFVGGQEKYHHHPRFDAVGLAVPGVAAKARPLLDRRCKHNPRAAAIGGAPDRLVAKSKRE
jgi:ketosteroid isomerase-like protein